MSYSKNPTWNSGGSPGVDAPALNNLETQYTEASLSFNPDILAAGFVLTGLVCTKDGTVASKLDVTAGTYYAVQSADSTLRQRKISTTNFTTSVASTTYYFDVNPDGTTSWGTSHSAVTNHLTICTVTTDGSANISTVTDTRTTAINLFNSATGVLQFNGSKVWTAGNDGSGSGLDGDTLRGLAPGNASGNIAVANGTVVTNLNADLLDGNSASAFAAVAPAGVKVYVQQTTPASPNTYDVWIKTTF